MTKGNIPRKPKTAKEQPPAKHPTQEQKQQEAIHAVRASGDLHPFHDKYDEGYCTVPSHVGSHRETWPIQSKRFRLWVMATFKKMGHRAPKAIVSAAVDDIEQDALVSGPLLPVEVRIAAQGAAFYVDLGNPDWQVIEITKDGWHILNESPVKFERHPALTALPHPEDGGALRDVSKFLNVGEQAEILLLTWLSYCLCPGRPFPVTAISGAQGTGKSTTTRVLRSLVDPSVAPITTVPKSERDLVIAAGNSHMLALDNVGEISAQFSDWLCRLSTGGGLRTRRLYKNSEEKIFSFTKPIIVNGISDLPTRSDLLSRTLLIHQEPIPEKNRMDEAAFWTAFNAIRPRVFGRLLDVVQVGMKNLPEVKLSAMPRMADFARWGVAVEQAIGFSKGAFLKAYAVNLQDTHAAAVDASPIAQAILDFLDDYSKKQNRQTYVGTASELLQALRDFLKMPNLEQPELEVFLRNPKFPNSPAALANELARVEPNLERMGVRVEKQRTAVTRVIKLTRFKDMPS